MTKQDKITLDILYRERQKILINYHNQMAELRQEHLKKLSEFYKKYYGIAPHLIEQVTIWRPESLDGNSTG